MKRKKKVPNQKFNTRAARQEFYQSAPWRTLRDYFLQISPLCEYCLDEVLAVPATEVDHKIDIKDKPELRLDSSNLQSLCQSCHNKKSSRTHLNSEKGMKPSNPKWIAEVMKLTEIINKPKD